VGATPLVGRPVVQGAHEVNVTCPDDPPEARHVTIAPGATTDIQVTCRTNAVVDVPPSVVWAEAVVDLDLVHVPVPATRASRPLAIPVARVVRASVPAIVLRDDGLVLVGGALPRDAMAYTVREGAGRELAALLVTTDEPTGLHLLRCPSPLVGGVFNPPSATQPAAPGAAPLSLALPAPDPVTGEILLRAELDDDGAVAGTLTPAPVEDVIQRGFYRLRADGADSGQALFRTSGAFVGVITRGPQPDGFARAVSAARPHTVVARSLSTTLLTAVQRMSSPAWTTTERAAETARRLTELFDGDGHFQPERLSAQDWSPTYLHETLTRFQVGAPREALLAAAWLWNGAAALLLRARTYDPAALPTDARGVYTRLVRTADELVHTALAREPSLLDRTPFLQVVERILHPTPPAREPPCAGECALPREPPGAPSPSFGVEVGLEGTAALRASPVTDLGASGGGLVGRLALAFTVARPLAWLHIELAPEVSLGWLRRDTPQARTDDTALAGAALGARVRFGRNASATLGAAWPFTMVLSSRGADYALAAWELRLGVHPWRTFGFTLGYREAHFADATPALYALSGALQWRVE
jgi:hypothetical protein